MGRETRIEWADSTFNPWWGCARVSAGCDHCYAETTAGRFGYDCWGPKAKRVSLSDKYWQGPVEWNRKAEAAGVRHRVFCGSMCDWTDNKAPAGQRARLWDLIRATPSLDWLLLTKRAGLIRGSLPTDWGRGYDNVWLGVTVENRAEGFPRIHQLTAIPAKVRFLSVEPLLENLGPMPLLGIHWVIVGGESGREARPMKPEWLHRVIGQCRTQNVSVFFKQWGGRVNKGGCLLDGEEIKQFPGG